MKRFLLTFAALAVAPVSAFGQAEDDAEKFKANMEKAQVEIMKHVRDGERFYNAKSYKEALQEFETAESQITRCPYEVKALTDLLPKVRECIAKAELEKMKADQAVMVRQLEVQQAQIKEMLDKMAGATADGADAHYRLAEKHFQSGDFVEAQKGCDRALSLKPDHAAAKALLQETRFARGRAKKAVEGKVTAAANDIGLVVISITKGDGVLEGDEYTVSRSGEFVAKIRIEKTDAKWSSGVVVFKKDDPRVGDDASNAILEVPLSEKSADALRDVRRELDDVRRQVRELSDKLLPSWGKFGLAADPLSDELRRCLGVERGYVVRRVSPGSIAEKSGLKAYDVAPGMSEAQLLDALEKGSAIRVLRQGKEQTLGGK